MTWLLVTVLLILAGPVALALSARHRPRFQPVLPSPAVGAFTPERVTPAQRQAIDSILEIVNPMLEREVSEDLKPQIPRIVQTCRALVLDDPRSMRFVEELRDTATCAALEESATCGTPIGEEGWGQLSERLERAFSGLAPTRHDTWS